MDRMIRIDYDGYEEVQDQDLVEIFQGDPHVEIFRDLYPGLRPVIERQDLGWDLDYAPSWVDEELIQAEDADICL